MILWRILVVDDEEQVALTIQRGLAKLPGCDVAIASNGGEAQQLLERQPFDLLITDYRMPGMDGITLAELARQLCPQLVIILMTAYNSDELREQAALSSVRCILDKPVRLTEIRCVALEALGESRDEAQPPC
mgnify:CR=1 FL=1